MRVLSLDHKIQRRTKDIPEEIELKTGYSKGIYLVSDKTGKIDQKCAKENENCIGETQVFELNLIGVLDEKGEEVSINKLSPEIKEILDSTNQKVKLCVFHLLENIADESLGKVGNE